MKSLRHFLIIPTIILFSTSFLIADTVELKSGEVIEGHFLSADRTYVKIQVGTLVRTFRADAVTVIRLGPSEDSQAAPATTSDQAPAAAQPSSAPPAETSNTPQPAQANSAPPPTPASTADAAPTSQPNQSEAAPSPAPASAPTQTTIPEGTYLSIRMIDSIDTATNQVGDTFTASTDDPIVINGVMAVPKNTIVHGKIIQAKSSGKIAGTPELQLELTDMMLDGQSIPLTTGEYRQVGSSRGNRSAEMIGGGAALGALIGAIAGKGKGVAIGAASGAAAGTAVQVLTKGNQLKIPSETLLSFRLDQPVTVPLNP